MVSLGSLWLPILLSALLVFVAGFVIHVLTGFHWNDFAPLPDEDDFMETIRRQGIGVGQYHFPRPATRAGFKDPVFVEKMKRGPTGLLFVMPPGMGGARTLTTHFIYCVAVSLFVAYLAGATLSPGAEYLSVFRVAGTAALLAYAGATFTNAIWFGWSWGSTWRHAFDGLVYALLTAGTFGWLWP